MIFTINQVKVLFFEFDRKSSANHERVYERFHMMIANMQANFRSF